MTLKNTVLTLRILYPIWMVFGIFSLLYIPSILIVKGDAVATANNLTENDFLFRAGIVGSLITQLIYIFTVLFLYKLFESVNKEQSILMLVLSLVAVPIAMLNTLNDVAALSLVSDPKQMMFFIDLSKQGILIAQIFWGLWLFPLGYLIIKSAYFPKLIGIAVVIGGVGYTFLSFVGLFTPNQKILLSIFETMTVGELIFLAWLIILGAKLPSSQNQ